MNNIFKKIKANNLLNFQDKKNEIKNFKFNNNKRKLNLKFCFP